MKIAASGMALALALFLLPWLLVPQMSDVEGGSGDSPLPPLSRADPTAGGGRDRGRVVKLSRQDGSVEELNMEDYLWGVVAAEMPASFESEALKAQAAAARTYTVSLQNAGVSKHGDAQVCDDSTCCQAYIDRAQAEGRWGLQAASYAGKISQAVAQTDGMGVLYQGRPIQAVFFSSTAGRTADAVEVWGNAVDYLRGVDSPEGEEVPNYHTQVILSQEEVRAQVLERYPGADLSGGAEGWFSDVEYSPSGMVSALRVGGVSLTGAQVRTLLGLRSACFTVSFQDGNFIFQVTGYGHGVGMSQYGANAMAKEGRSYQDILTWYYTGTQIGYLWE